MTYKILLAASYLFWLGYSECELGEVEYDYDICIKKSRYFTDFTFVDVQVSDHIFHVRSDFAYDKLVAAAQSGNQYDYLAYTKLVADALVANFGDNWHVVLVSTYNNIAPSGSGFSGSATYTGYGNPPKTKLQGVVRMAGNYFGGQGGPYLHEIGHQWGVYLSDLMTDNEGCGGHWGFSGLDVWGQLGGFDYQHIYCQSPKGRQPTKNKPCNDNGLIFVDELYGSGGGSPTTHYDGTVGNPFPYARFELLNMGLLSASEMPGEKWLFCHTPCQSDNPDLVLEQDFDPSLWGIDIELERWNMLNAWLVDCSKVSWFSAQDVVNAWTDFTTDRQMSPGGTVDIGFVLVYPSSADLPNTGTVSVYETVQIAEIYAANLPTLFSEATYGLGGMSVSTLLGSQVANPLECQQDSVCIGDAVCQMYYGDWGRCQKQLDISGIGRSCFDGSEGVSFYMRQSGSDTTSASKTGIYLKWLFDKMFIAAGTWNDRVYFAPLQLQPSENMYVVIYFDENERRWAGSDTLGASQPHIFCDNGAASPFDCTWSRHYIEIQSGPSQGYWTWTDEGEKLSVAALVYGSCGIPDRGGPPTLPTFSSSGAEDDAETNACAANPCQNSGTCTDVAGGAADASGRICACAGGYRGESCEIEPEVDACYSSPCLNGGTCTDIPGGAADASGRTCVCGDGYTGESCETDVGGDAPELASQPSQEEIQCEALDKFQCKKQKKDCQYMYKSYCQNKGNPRVFATCAEISNKTACGKLKRATEGDCVWVGSKNAGQCTLVDITNPIRGMKCADFKITNGQICASLSGCKWNKTKKQCAGKIE